MAAEDIYLLPLNDDGSPQIIGGGDYIYLTPTSDATLLIRFSIEGTSSICHHGSLWTNIPPTGVPFRRDNFRQFKLKPQFNRSIEITVPIYGAGAFAFYTTYVELPELDLNHRYGSCKPENTLRKSPLFYINVAPRLQLKGAHLPLPALSIFSVISKFMGRYPYDWETHLQSISKRGYNMVHFTPLQIRGESDSPFSLLDQLGWDLSSFPGGEADVEHLIQSLEENHSLLSLTDIVLNHTANNTPWLRDHPEAGYNLTTAPWLEAAYELDTNLLKLGQRLKSLNIPVDLQSTDDLMRIMEVIETEVIAKIRLWEFYALDVDRDVDAAVDAWMQGQTTGSLAADGFQEATQRLRSRQLSDQVDFLRRFALRGLDSLGERHKRKIDPIAASDMLSFTFGRYEENQPGRPDQAAARAKMVAILDAINVDFYHEYDVDVREILEQLYNRIKYVRLDDHGPKLGPINEENPLIETYFTRLSSSTDATQGKSRDLALVNNGWVWGGDAMVDNAGPESRVYLRREVIVWGDCVKLRYGTRPEESPWLWKHMTEYACMLAKSFAGFRIDNCHSTPIHVAEHVLDEARRIRPNLYIVAELFTGSEETDQVFVKRLGLSSLIREAMQAWNTAELSRLVHRHGGRPIGSFEVIGNAGRKGKLLASGSNGDASGSHASGGVIKRIKSNPINALFMDCTHDNELPAQKRDARDTLPNAALVSMCASATGSVMGYDEIYPKLIDLVNDRRQYASESAQIPPKLNYGSAGIGSVRKLLSKIHTDMGKDGYNETHVHHEHEFITVHRVHPESRKGYFLIAHTAFLGFGNGRNDLKPVRLPGTRAIPLGSWSLEVDSGIDVVREVLSDNKYFRGLPSRLIEQKGVEATVDGNDLVITLRCDFPPGSIALFETWLPAAERSTSLDAFIKEGAEEAWSSLNLVSLNSLMYRCEAEELDVSSGRDGIYEIPDFGKLVYAGLQGWWTVLEAIARDNDLAHPLCQNLRSGQWALDYICGRLNRLREIEGNEQLNGPARWLEERFDAIRPLPSFLLPRYFSLVLGTAYHASFERAVALMSSNINDGQWFLQCLALVSVQQNGYVRSASLWPDKTVPCIAAGLPHFAVEWARCWGRDVFISIRGLFLGTGRFIEAKEHVLAFASVLKHGMIPNLLSSGDSPRYNSRDSVWFFLQLIQDFCRLAPQGSLILKEKVRRRFLPYDDSWFPASDPRAYSKESSVEEVIQEALQRHAVGITFREANAGPEIDRQMRSEGFDQDIRADWETGFVFGGNQFNCGTWMDKMGESERAGSKGIPGTPRDGAAVEITGLLYSTLKWVSTLHNQGEYQNAGITKLDGSRVTFAEWAERIQNNFERCFYVPLSPADDGKYEVNSNVINRRGIYKDLYRSGKEYEDYQLRPNFPIAMAVAPELFNPSRAFHALCIADKVLRGPTGMATLDPSDLNYRPYYHNSEDSDDFATSKGRNYHQGPEWLWPTGFFLRALLRFDLARRTKAEGRVEAFLQVTRRLEGCKQMMRTSAWAGLAELTQKNGEFCHDSDQFELASSGWKLMRFTEPDAGMVGWLPHRLVHGRAGTAATVDEGVIPAARSPTSSEHLQPCPRPLQVTFTPQHLSYTALNV